MTSFIWPKRCFFFHFFSGHVGKSHVGKLCMLEKRKIGKIVLSFSNMHNFPTCTKFSNMHSKFSNMIFQHDHTPQKKTMNFQKFYSRAVAVSDCMPDNGYCFGYKKKRIARAHGNILLRAVGTWSSNWPIIWVDIIVRVVVFIAMAVTSNDNLNIAVEFSITIFPCEKSHSNLPAQVWPRRSQSDKNENEFDLPWQSLAFRRIADAAFSTF